MEWNDSGLGRRQATLEEQPSPACEEHAELFFAERPEDLALAKSLCTGCPMQRECLDGALQRGEPWGVWGGELVIGGVVTRHKRGRGRPRKAHTACA